EALETFRARSVAGEQASQRAGEDLPLRRLEPAEKANVAPTQQVLRRPARADRPGEQGQRAAHDSVRLLSGIAREEIFGKQLVEESDQRFLVFALVLVVRPLLIAEFAEVVLDDEETLPDLIQCERIEMQRHDAT